LFCFFVFFCFVLFWFLHAAWPITCLSFYNIKPFRLMCQSRWVRNNCINKWTILLIEIYCTHSSEHKRLKAFSMFTGNLVIAELKDACWYQRGILHGRALIKLISTYPYWDKMVSVYYTLLWIRISCNLWYTK